MKKQNLLITLLIILVFISNVSWLFIYKVNISNFSRNNNPFNEEITMTPLSLLDSFMQFPEITDKYCKNKMIKLEFCYFYKSGKDEMGKNFILVGKKNDIEKKGVIKCYFDLSDISFNETIDKIKKENVFTIKGRCDGSTLSDGKILIVISICAISKIQI